MNIELQNLQQTIKELRTPNTGCPWNIKQTHQSLKKYLLEESYECLQAIDKFTENHSKDNITELCDELGDILLQVVLHSAIAEDNNAFTFEDIAKMSNQKMRRRHPHVFSEYQLDNNDLDASLDSMWESVKQSEKDNNNQEVKPTIFDNIPQELPALHRIIKVLKKADKYNINLDKIQDKYTINSLDMPDNTEDLEKILISLAFHCKDKQLNMEDTLRQAINNIESDLI